MPYYIYNEHLNLNSIEFPVIVKPCKCGSSIGINVCNNKKELIKAIKIAKKYDNNILIEKFLSNKLELECAVLKNKNKLYISDIGEIKNENNWYDYNSKYINKINTEISDIDKKLKKEIRSISKKIFNILNCKDLSRIDFFCDLDNEKLYVNEINTIPGALSYYLFESKGIYFDELLDKLIALTMKRDYKKKQLLTHFETSVLSDINTLSMKK